MARHGRAWSDVGWVLVVLGPLLTGCPRPQPPQYAFVPMHEAIRQVNANNARLGHPPGGIKASPVDATGQLRESRESSPRSFSLAGTLVFRKPKDLVLQLREGLGGSPVMQAGSNQHEYWLWVKPEINTLWWGLHTRDEAPVQEREEDAATQPAASGPSPDTRPASGNTPSPATPRDEMPIRPDHLIEVLGLSELPTDTTGPDGPVYRPEETRNVLIFLAYDADGQAYIQKEYYLDRAPPYLVREILFREADGRIQMRAALTEHAVVPTTNAYAPHRIRIDWPAADSWLELRLRRLMTPPEPFPAPTSPITSGARFSRLIRVPTNETSPSAPGGAL